MSGIFSLTLFLSVHSTLFALPLSAGKTALLAALLNEMNVRGGSVVINGCADRARVRRLGTEFAAAAAAASRVAFVPQTAWITNASLKDNVVFSRPFDEKRYNAVVAAGASAFSPFHLV